MNMTAMVLSALLLWQGSYRDFGRGMRSGMDLEILRRGKRATLQVEPVGSQSKR